MQRCAAMMTLADFGNLSPAEARFIEGASSGERVIIGDGERPTESNPDVTIRAALIRMTLLREDATVRLHEKGVRLRGAWISGMLDFQGADCTMDLTLSRCFPENPAFH